MKKVLYFIPGLTMGGAETLVKDYCLNLDKSRFDVTLLCSIKRGAPYEELLSKAGIKTIFINDYSKKEPSIRQKVINYFLRYLKVRRIINKIKPDILHIHLDLCSLVKFANPKCEVYYTVHNTPEFVWNDKPREERACAWLIKHKNMKFITLHDNMRVDVNNRFGVNNSIVLNNGINFDKFNFQINKDQYKANLGIPLNRTIVGHVGRFMPQKNHNFLVDIFYEYKKLNPSAFLLMIGDGILQGGVEAKLERLGLDKDYMILSNRTDVPQLLSLMDYFVFPSFHEGLSVVMVEVQKAGIKAVVSHNVIPDELLLSNLIKPMSLSDDSRIWARELKNFNVPKVVYKDIDSWNMKNVIKKLESIYDPKNYKIG